MDFSDIYLYTVGIIFILMGIISNEGFMKDFIFVGIGIMFGPFVYYAFLSQLIP